MFSALPKLDFMSARQDSVTGGQTFEVRNSAGNSEVLSDNGTLQFLLKRKFDDRENRKWEHTLWEGENLFHAQEENAEPAITLIRLQQEFLIRLQGPAGVLTDLVRLEHKHGYVNSDPRHRFSLDGHSYLLSARTHSHLFGGRDVDCVDEASGELVMQFMDKNFSRHISGSLMVSSKFTGTSLAVMVAAFLAFQEFDTRMKQLVFGDQYWNRKVTA